MIDSEAQKQKQQQQQRYMEYPHIPSEMFRIFPQQQKMFYMGEDKNIRRFLFQGIAFENSLTTFEKQKNLEFQEYIEKNKKNLPMGILNDPFWTNSWKFRWLASQQYDFKNTIKAIQKHSQYLKQNRTQPSANSIKFLKQGVFYVCGRDAYYRPILVFDVDRMLKSKMTQEELLESQKFFFQKILSSYLLPGQVETWVAIIDAGYNNIFSFLNPLKSSIQYLSGTFRSRMKAAYLVRCPTSVNLIWSIVKKFMHKDTIEKINFMKSQKIPPLMEYTNHSQIQQRYGGTKPNMTQYWPVEPFWELSSQYDHPNVKFNFISKQQYNKLYYSGKLKEHIISKVLIDENSQYAPKKETEKAVQINNLEQSINLKQKALEQLPNEEIPQLVPHVQLCEVFNWDSFLKIKEMK